MHVQFFNNSCTVKMSSSIQCILFVLILVQIAFSKKELFGIFDRIELCGRPPSPRVKWENFTIFLENGSSVVNSNFEIFGDTIKTEEVNICILREALDTCQDYHTLVTSNTCQVMTLEQLMWRPFMKAFRPPFECPLKSGKYRQTKGWFDVTKFLLFPIEQYYWKFEITGTSRRIHLVTFCIDVRIQRKNN